MADQWSGGQSGPGERWNVNLPAVIGVVFVFLVGVIVWVVAASGSGDDGALPGESVPSVPTSTSPVSTAVPTTTPLPMPSTTIVPPTAPPTVAPATAPPATPAPTVAPTLVPPTLVPPTAPPTQPPTTLAPTTVAQTTVAPAPTTTRPTTTVPASSVDLGVPGHPITQPPCDGGYITVLGSAIGDQATADSMAAVLNQYPGSNYLRTDVTCSSLTPSSNGQPIYVVYFGPFATDREACAARTQGPKDAYVRRLSNDLPPTHSVQCK
jgi:serine/threonine-protein kinase